MDVATNPVTLRIACCRRQREKARTHIEQEAWRAEEEGSKRRRPSPRSHQQIPGAITNHT
ncbi:MAG: hypothetical protein U0236_11620 [Nitrospira sp.]